MKWALLVMLFIFELSLFTQESSHSWTYDKSTVRIARSCRERSSRGSWTRPLPASLWL